jgi:8-oxo-dGTP pyrophosphatase MutT (NUDIX family)
MVLRHEQAHDGAGEVALPVACVAVALIDSAGQVLLQQRDPDVRIAFPDHWALPAGAPRLGETPEQAVAREVSEELRPRLASRALRFHRLTVVPGPNGAEQLFTAVLPDGEWRLAEGAGSGLFELGALPEPIPPHHAAMLDAVRRQRAA